MKSIMRFLDGKKTYIGAAALFILGGLLALNIIDQKTFESATVIVSAWTAYGIRDAIKGIE